VTEFLDTLGYRLVRLGRVAGHEYAARLERLGLRPLHVRLLTAIRDADTAPQYEHAAELGVSPGFVVRLADDLERLGAVTRTRDAQDRRRQTMALTPAGVDLLCGATRLAVELDEQLTRGLSPGALAQLAASLEIIRASVGSGRDDRCRQHATVDQCKGGRRPSRSGRHPLHFPEMAVRIGEVADSLGSPERAVGGRS
jgi:DNA-binding MarR family transcriptional regulator